MKIGKPIHSKLIIEPTLDFHLAQSATRMEPTFENEIYYDKNEKILTLWWEIEIFFDGIKGLVISAYTKTEILSTGDYEADFPHATNLIVESCGAFFDKLKKEFTKAPMIEPAFEEISAKLLESLTDAGLY